MLFFDLLTADQQGKACEFGTFKNYNARSLIIRQGEQANGIYIIFSGIVESVFYTESERELQLATWSKKDFIGAPHVFGKATQQWSARALTNVELLHLNQVQLRSLINYSPDFSVSLIQVLGHKGERYSELAQRLAFYTVQERLALALLDTWYRANKCKTNFESVPIPSLLELSRSIGSTRQAVGLALKSLSKRGLINVDEGRFWLPCTKSLVDSIGGKSLHFTMHNSTALN